MLLNIIYLVYSSLFIINKKKRNIKLRKIDKMKKKLLVSKYTITSIYFTLFEFKFIDITTNNYSQVDTVNSKTPLFIVASDTIL